MASNIETALPEDFVYIGKGRIKKKNNLLVNTTKQSPIETSLKFLQIHKYLIT